MISKKYNIRKFFLIKHIFVLYTVLITSFTAFLPDSASAQSCSPAPNTVNDDTATVNANSSVTIPVSENDSLSGLFIDVMADDPRARVIDRGVSPQGIPIYDIEFTAGSVVGTVVEEFTYSVLAIIDGGGTECDTARVEVTIIGSVPVIPIDAVNDEQNITDSSTVNIDVLPNDEGERPLTIIDAAQGSNGGKVKINSGASIDYEPPDPLPNRFVDTFTYTIRDSANQEDTATVTVRGPVTPVIDDVDAINDVITLENSNKINIDVLENDLGDPLPLAITQAGQGAQGNVTIVNGEIH